MFKGRKLYVGLGVVGLFLLLGALGIAYAQGLEPTLEREYSIRSAQWPRPPRDESCEPRLLSANRPVGELLGPFGGAWTTTFDATAEALELSPTELFERLHEGKTVAEVAEAQGVDLEAVGAAREEAQIEARKQALEQAVEEGCLDEDQAEWVMEGLEQGFTPHGKGFGPGGCLPRQHGGQGRGMRR